MEALSTASYDIQCTIADVLTVHDTRNKYHAVHNLSIIATCTLFLFFVYLRFIVADKSCLADL